MRLATPIRKGAPLLVVPLSLVLHHTNAVAPVWIFLAGLVAIAVLADWVRQGTEQVAGHAGATIGSLLNVSFGNAAELVLALFVLSQAQTQVVQAQITGSIIGTTLLFLGIAALAGGLRHERQSFGKAQVGLLSTLLLLLAVAILLPAVFDMTERVLSPGAGRALPDEWLSLCVSVVLLLLYGAHLLYVLVTHRTMFATGAEGGTPSWSLKLGLAVMVCGTVAIAVESELVTTRLAETAAQPGCRRCSWASSYWRWSARWPTCSLRWHSRGRTGWTSRSAYAWARRCKSRWSSHPCWCWCPGPSATR